MSADPYRRRCPSIPDATFLPPVPKKRPRRRWVIRWGDLFLTERVNFGEALMHPLKWRERIYAHDFESEDRAAQELGALRMRETFPGQFRGAKVVCLGLSRAEKIAKAAKEFRDAIHHLHDVGESKLPGAKTALARAQIAAVRLFEKLEGYESR